MLTSVSWSTLHHHNSHRTAFQYITPNTTTATHLRNGKRYPIDKETDISTLVSLLSGRQQRPRASVIGVEGGGLVVLSHGVPAFNIITGGGGMQVCVQEQSCEEIQNNMVSKNERSTAPTACKLDTCSSH